MEAITMFNSLKASSALTASGLLLSALLGTLSLSGCQSIAPTHQTMHVPMSPQAAVESMEVLAAPIADTGLSVDADSSFPIIELMPYIVGQADALALTPVQVKVFADYRKIAMKNRLGLQANEKALRGQLRTALMADADDATTTALMHRISATEMAHMDLRRQCIKLVRSTLTSTQFAQLMKMYEQSLKR